MTTYAGFLSGQCKAIFGTPDYHISAFACVGPSTESRPPWGGEGGTVTRTSFDESKVEALRAVLAGATPSALASAG